MNSKASPRPFDPAPIRAGFLFFAAVLLLPAPPSASAGESAAPPVEVFSAGSRLDSIELGHLVNIVRLAGQDLDDWTGWEGRDQEGLEARRYQIAFMAYALTLQQYHCLPAWRELHRATLARLIERMIQKPVWEFWAEVSKTRRTYDPDWEGPLPAKHDPVGEKNIMYSGHLVHMAALYESLYRDDRWSRPGAFTFRWSPEEAYEYDLQSLLKVIRAEMLSPRAKGGACVAGVECEPNLIFPECNQHPLLAFQLNDARRGTAMFAEAKERLGAFFDCVGMYDPSTGSVANAYRVKQAFLINLPNMPSPSADGWTGAFMYSWDPERVRGNYERQKARDIKPDPRGGIRLAFDPMFELGAGFFALLAVELGDLETANVLFEHAAQKHNPVWEEGAFRHRPGKSPADKFSNTADKVLAMARSNRPEGLRRLHEEPWNDSAFAHPLIEGIDFPRTLVREARWIEDRAALIVELLPGPGAAPETSFRVAGVQPGELWSIVEGESAIGALGPDGVTAGCVVKGPAAGGLEIRIPLPGPRRLEIRRSK